MLFVYFRSDGLTLKFSDLIILILIGTVSTLIFARLLFVAAMIPQIEPTLENIFYYLINGGIVFYGGLFGLIIGICIGSKVLKKNSLEILDVIAPAIPLFHCFARIGCLFAGCCYGIPWSWGVIMEGEDFIRFPVQAFESLCNLIIFVTIVMYNSRTRSYEHSLKVYLCSYALCRFVLEFFRGDSVRGIWFLGLSTAQIISVLILVCAGGLQIAKAIHTKAFSSTL